MMPRYKIAALSPGRIRFGGPLGRLAAQEGVNQQIQRDSGSGYPKAGVAIFHVFLPHYPFSFTPLPSIL